MKGVQCYELFSGIALENHSFFFCFEFCQIHEKHCPSIGSCDQVTGGGDGSVRQWFLPDPITPVDKQCVALADPDDAQVHYGEHMSHNSMLSDQSICFSVR